MLLIASSFIPALFIAVFFYAMDKHKEPLYYLARAFVAGMLSILLVILLILLLPEIRLTHGPDRNALIDAFYNAAFKEELSKFVLLMLCTWRARHFDEWYDGILYGVLVGLGFAFIENIKYFYQFYDDSGWYVIIGRTIFSMPLHALLGGTMGYFIGKFRFSAGPDRVQWLLLALVIPVLVHGLFNFSLTVLVVNLKWLILPIVFLLWVRVLAYKKVTQSGQSPG
ncbi:MAG TPA: PrsW family glutamic-type intramembrane protease [bacterium]|nr:PrsW family glutamic-type intramembrane protease [bacterium]HPR88202.1 PrsW family glutamic-type intramembrane protease [bacterium]